MCPTASASQTEQALRLVVHHRHPAVDVEGEDALADAVQGSLALLQEQGDLLELEAEGASFEVPGEDPRRHSAEPERDAEPRAYAGSSCSRALDTELSLSPTDTSPTRLPSSPRSGAFPLAEGPVLPWSEPTWTRPSATTMGSSTRWPIRAGLGCECRTRFRSMTTTYEAPVSFLMDVARRWIVAAQPGASCCMQRRMSGTAAVVSAIAAARASYWLSSWARSCRMTAEPDEHGHRQDDQLRNEDLAGQSTHPGPHGALIVTGPLTPTRRPDGQQNEQNVGIRGKGALPAKPWRNTAAPLTFCRQQ